MNVNTYLGFRFRWVTQYIKTRPAPGPLVLPDENCPSASALKYNSYSKLHNAIYRVSLLGLGVHSNH